jgi:hypothetical protein
MQLRWIIVAGVAALVVAWWEASFLVLYVGMIGCMILYGLRKIILQLDERDAAIDVEDPEE